MVNLVFSLACVLAVILIFFGGKRIPQIMKDLRGYRSFKMHVGLRKLRRRRTDAATTTAEKPAEEKKVTPKARNIPRDLRRGPWPPFLFPWTCA